MKITQLTLTATGLFAAAWLGLSQETEGFSKIGGSLGLGQRDFRVFNNFADTQTNNNETINDQFPGYDGAELAIWKACIEWGSELHGDGTGDPSQQGDVGSGQANFDPSFQGNAVNIGDTNGNTHSALAGSQGGTLAFAETPISNGWRIRYLDGFTWADGPGTGLGGGQIDLQGVATHEYGHALGLGHSTVGGATMLASIIGNGVAARSITADDRAGVQCIYGVADSGKPSISSIAVTGSNLSVFGTNFDASDNDVWFTQAGQGGDGTPIRVFGLPSIGGTRIDVTIPGNAGPGDVLVRNQNGTFASLSNAFPFAGEDECPPPTNFCITSPHSSGPGAFMSATGDGSISANSLSLEANDAPADRFGIFFYGPNQVQLAFGDGVRCVGGSTNRLPLIQTDFVGFASFDIDLTTANDITVGGTQNFQFWFRDPMGPGGTGFNTSDGLSVFFCE